MSTNGGQYYNPGQAASVKKSLVDDATRRAIEVSNYLKRAPADLSEAQFSALLGEIAAKLEADLHQILHS